MNAERMHDGGWSGLADLSPRGFLPATRGLNWDVPASGLKGAGVVPAPDRGYRDGASADLGVAGTRPVEKCSEIGSFRSVSTNPGELQGGADRQTTRCVSLRV
jgi:hypothetical protein